MISYSLPLFQLFVVWEKKGHIVQVISAKIQDCGNQGWFVTKKGREIVQESSVASVKIENDFVGDTLLLGKQPQGIILQFNIRKHLLEGYKVGTGYWDC